MPVKEWKPIEKQIETLHSRGMIMDDESRVYRYLQRVGYFRLSGYSYSFRSVDRNGELLDRFIEGSRFSHVIELYLFDRKLRLLALDALERIELSLQVEIATVLGKRDTYAHEMAKHLHGEFTKKILRDGETKHVKWLSGYHSLIRRSSRKQVVNHYMSKYGKLPIWVAMDVFDFGTLSKLYAGLKLHDKILIQKQFNLENGWYFQSWLRSLNFVRNTAAHQSRLWNCNILERPSIHKNMANLKTLKNSRSFLCFCIMQVLMDVVCPDSQWKQRFKDLLATFPNVDNGAVQLSDMGLIEGWEQWDLWK